MGRRLLSIVASLWVLTCAAAAQHSAHVHGIAALNLAIEGGELEIEFVSPAGNIVGFEHEAVTPGERRAIRDAIEQLKEGNALFELPHAASCSLHVADVEHGHQEEEDPTDGPGHGATHADHDEHEHAEAEHEDGPGHDGKHDGHDEHEHAEEKGDGTHSEFHAHYHYECDGSAITAIGVRLFEHWPRIKEIRVQALTPAGQFGGVTKANDPMIRVK